MEGPIYSRWIHGTQHERAEMNNDPGPFSALARKVGLPVSQDHIQPRNPESPREESTGGDAMREKECRNCGHEYLPNENIFQHDCKNPLRGDTTFPRVKALGQQGYTEMTLRDIAEMCAAHADHMGARISAECACVELVDRTLTILLNRCEAVAAAGVGGGRYFRQALLKAVEEL